MPQPRLDYNDAAPEGLQALLGVNEYTQACSIDTRLKLLIELRVSQINGCAFCIDKHSQEARAQDESQQRLDCLSVWRETTFYNNREQAALAWAEVVTRLPSEEVPEGFYQKMRLEFSEKEIVDLTIIIVMMNAWNRLAISMKQGPAKRTN
ncbi:carboxymuconolactone decarboxylase family protein [Gimesia aquarii]|uniref:Carboxymuconolactone decarboxylase family protein n=1 Tax=Gimesia aquarii TaxID=2527964 RepID=A0A517VUE6_9PLAN|nr:carboxymuconolactone decarboxylase family protein [Gimesia aquarii]QDT96627.1 Carboxymuconolactone decarboxylase family protein [Gimesia aquarii]